MADLQGPKIRVGKFAEGKVMLEPGAAFVLDASRTELGDLQGVGLDYKELPRDVKAGDVLLLNDGLIVLNVVAVKGEQVHTTVKLGGELSNNKGINKQGGGLTAPALTAKDMDDIKTAMSLQADYVAVSFPKNATDMEMARQLCNVACTNGHRPGLIAKIERAEAIPELDRILAVSDGIMVARGDLAVEVGNAAVPGLQKHMIKRARELDKLVITATQMMESMIVNPVPTRAEVSDVANAVLDGADALMLSGETSVGIDPIHVVQTMSRIITHIEAEALESLPKLADDAHGETAKAMCLAAVDVATHVAAVSVVAFTETGSSARLVARHRSRTRLLAFTPNEDVRNRLSLVWGTETFLAPSVSHTDEMVAQLDKVLLDLGIFKLHDPIVVIAGVPPGVPGSTNGMRVHRLGHGANNA
jgi:pyruvate kinase